MTDRIGWAVVGAGWVARDYVGPALANSRNGRVVAAVDPSPRALAAFLPGVAMLRTDDLAAVLARPDVDAV